jgi:membrane associated rhomboid family serine protease
MASFNPGRLSVTSWLIIINVAVFLLDAVLPVVDIADARAVLSTADTAQVERAVVLETPRPSVPLGVSWQRPLVDPITQSIVGYDVYRSWHFLNGWGHFSLLKGLLAFEVWRVVTFQFLHADLSHLFFNMLGLFFFGAMVEQQLGRRRYLAFYLVCGVSGGLLYMILAGLNAIGVPLPGELSLTTPGTPLIGASAGVFGVVVACARIAPHSEALLFMIIPVRMWMLAYGYVAIAAFNLIMGGRNAGGDAAHIGGAIAGFYFIRHAHLLRDFLDFRIGPGVERRPRRTGGNQRAIDRILDKIRNSGMQSLTEREKRTLIRASDEARDRE